MKVYEIGTGYTPIPARIAAATETVVEGLTRALQKQGLSVQILDIQAKDRPATDLPIREVPVPACFSGTDVKLGLMHKLKRVVYSVCLAAKLREILQNADQTIILHFHNQYNLFFFLLLVPGRLRRRARIAYTNHSGIWGLPWEKIEKTVKKRYFQEALCMKKADFLFVLNEETAENVKAHLGVPQSRIFLAANGVDTDIYRPLDWDTKAEFGLSGKTVILQAGSVCENKGQLRAAQYLLPVLKENADVVYAYAGGIVEEAYQAKLRCFAQENGLEDQIRCLGMVPPGQKLSELYHAAEVTVLLSRYEAFGLVAVESMAAGVPVVIEKTCPAPFEKGCIRCDGAHFAETIRELLQTDTVQLRAAARDYAVTCCSWDAVAEKYAEVFRNGMKDNG